MKALVVPVLGNPVVVTGDWDAAGVIAAVLDCETFELVNIPGTHKPALSLYFDEEGKYERDVNKVATSLVAEVLQVGDYIAGPAMIIGYDPESGDSVDLDLLDIVRLGARLVRAERNALQ